MNTSSYTLPRHRTSLTALIILLVWCLGVALVITRHQQIQDYLRLRNYHPPQAVSAMARDDTLTAKARRIFYVNHPQVEDKTAFTSHCPGTQEQTIVLGCYHGNQNGVYLLRVTDPRLNGVQQVTAAHEMLHAAYDRLDGQEKQRVNRLLEDYYTHDLHDERILTTIDAYKKSEPNDVVNEMHSIFGTEITSLTPALEQYYSQYFVNRHQVVGFAEQYEQEFSSRQAVIKHDDSLLAVLKAQIKTTEDTLTSQQQEIASRQKALQAQQNSGNIAAYNAGVPAFNQLVDSYNANVRAVQSLIAQYNQLVASRNAVAAEISALSSALSSEVAPIQR